MLSTILPDRINVTGVLLLLTAFGKNDSAQGNCPEYKLIAKPDEPTYR